MEAAQTPGGGSSGAGGAPAPKRTQLCTSLVAPTIEGMLAEAQEAVANGADIVELRLDYLEQFSPEEDLPRLLKQCPLPAIVTYRPIWEG
jgi:3-dehydroquinate dehydratase/shikimate dehydrogenase